MNFLAHFVIATRFLTPIEPLPAYVVGTALPDLLPLAAKRTRLRPAHLQGVELRMQFGVALGAGVSAHLRSDAAFHKTEAFAEAQAVVSDLLAAAAFEEMRVRRFFVAHVLTELTLDAVLLRAEPALLADFYTNFAAADFAAVACWAGAVSQKPLPNLPAVLTRFAGSQYLRQYARNEGVASGLSQTCGRARQDTFEGANFDRLIEVVRQAIERLPEYVPALLSETAAGIFAFKQEVAQTAANAGVPTDFVPTDFVQQGKA